VKAFAKPAELILLFSRLLKISYRVIGVLPARTMQCLTASAN